jgi:amino acid adenylation domain-containing protein
MVMPEKRGEDLQTETTFLKRMAELSPAKQALLEKRLHSTPAQEQNIPWRSQDGPAPLSFAQQRLWFLQQLEPESTVYNEAMASRMRGPLNVEALAQAAREIMRRHEVLRSTYPTIDGQTRQSIDPSLHESWTVPLIDLGGIPAAEREEEAQRRIAQEVQRPFHLDQEVPWRTALVQLDEEEYIALNIMHHIITDAWSMEVFVRELTTLYAAFSAGQPSPLPQTPVQYSDYAEWQRRWLEGGVLEGELAYWKRQLSGSLPVLKLPTDHPRPSVQTYSGRRYPLTAHKSLSQALHTFSRQEGVTLFMTLLAAFKVLLYRYTQQDDLLIGSPIANRIHPELEHLLGCFVNTLVLRTDLSGNPTFLELLQRVRKVTLEAYEHQDVPFEKLVEELQPERTLSHSPLFQTMFVLQNVPLATQELAGLTISPFEIEHTTAKFDLSLCLQETPAGLQGYLEYNTDLFTSRTIEQVSAHLITLLEAIVAAPIQRIAYLPLLSEYEQQQVLVGWNSTQAPYPYEQCFHRLFEAQVERTPAAVAAVCGTEQLTYQQLNQGANQLASYLVHEQKVGPESLVAVLAERSIPLLAALLATFKAGGAYLPLDPQHPPSRLHHILGHSRCRLVLTTRSFASRLNQVMEEMPEEARPVVVFLEEMQTQEYGSENLSIQTVPRQLAYVIYTSGSTGKPKGAMVEHRGMLNHLYAKIEALQLQEADRVAQTASQCFDISIWQFLAALLIGGQVQIFPDEVTHNPVELLTQVEQQQISILEIVPSMLRAMIDFLESTRLPRPELAALRWLIATGEALPADLCRRWMSIYSRIPLMNAYGPTECSDDVTHHVIEAGSMTTAPHSDSPTELRQDQRSIPIGRAIGNTSLYVLDENMTPVPVGVHGELYVGGVDVGRGYLADAPRTAEAFVPDPFTGTPGARLYRTGDVARYLHDGTLEFLGRRDHQVKIRGYRIELGEIEVVLTQHPGVRECVVLAREDTPGHRHLVAYIVGQTELPTTAEQLQHLAKEMLPDYMVPSAFVFLETLPLTPNRKLDRRALPAPRENQLIADTAYVAPRTPVEAKLAEMWSQLLGVERVGIHDNFFEVGGHSLLVTQAVARIRDLFEVELPIRLLFKVSTIAELAQAIEKVKARSEELRKPAVSAVSREVYRLRRGSFTTEGKSAQAGKEG